MIAELNNKGIPAVKYFDESPEYREVKAGAQYHAELINSGKYRVFRDIEHLDELEDEYATYRWDKDESEEYSKKEEPIKENDDLMDAERYCSIGIRYQLKDRPKEYQTPAKLAHRIDKWNPWDEDNVKDSPEDY
jgi:hypothetical protein